MALPFQAAKQAGGSVKNNGGIVVNAGNVADKLTSLDLIGLNTGRDYGSKVPQDTASGVFQYVDPHGVIPAKANGTGGFAYFPKSPDRNFIIRYAGDSASKINNDASTLLTIPGGVSTQGALHKLNSTHRVGAQASRSFNVYAAPSSGVFPGLVLGSGYGATSSFVQKDGSTAAIDNAASPTRAVPGGLTYMFGALKKPTSVSYKAKDSYES
jgi:hypothetical protein